jgi:hypothetical protein
MTYGDLGRFLLLLGLIALVGVLSAGVIALASG